MIVRWAAALVIVATLALGVARAQISSGPQSFAQPAGAAASTGLVYASNAPVVVNSSTTTSIFPPGSASARTMAAGTLTPGRAFLILAAGIYTAPAANTLSADIFVRVGATTVVSVTTPAALVANNQGADFHAACVINTATTITCTGLFVFSVLGSNPVVVPVNSINARTFDPTVPNLIDVLGDWNGATTTHATTVQTASLILLN